MVWYVILIVSASLFLSPLLFFQESSFPLLALAILATICNVSHASLNPMLSTSDFELDTSSLRYFCAVCVCVRDEINIPVIFEYGLYDHSIFLPRNFLLGHTSIYEICLYISEV